MTGSGMGQRGAFTRSADGGSYYVEERGGAIGAMLPTS